MKITAFHLDSSLPVGTGWWLDHQWKRSRPRVFLFLSEFVKIIRNICFTLWFCRCYLYQVSAVKMVDDLVPCLMWIFLQVVLLLVWRRRRCRLWVWNHTTRQKSSSITLAQVGFCPTFQNNVTEQSLRLGSVEPVVCYCHTAQISTHPGPDEEYLMKFYIYFIIFIVKETWNQYHHYSWFVS